MNILAFDIGIKNLAYALYNTVSGELISIQNTNIMENNISNDTGNTGNIGNIDGDISGGNSGGNSGGTVSIKCSKCRFNAIYMAGQMNYCRKHIPTGYIIPNEFQQQTGETPKYYSTYPPISILKKIAKECGVKSTGKKQDIINAIGEKCVLPVIKTKPKKIKVATIPMTELHDAIISFVDKNLSFFSMANVVLLENQPVLKNPQMKTVQMLLFATLRLRLQPLNSSIIWKLVHAKKKVSGATKGDAGYNERKKGSELRISDSGIISKSSPCIQHIWNSSKKKSDISDAICMCLDYMR